MILTPKNWASFQHYKQRHPPWIRLYRSLLDDFDFHCLPVASRALAPCIWLLASEYQDGRITASTETIAFRLHMTVKDLQSSLGPLIEKGFLIDASNTLAERKQIATPETETETETERVLRTRRARARSDTSLPENWKPSEADRAYARSKGWPEERIDREAERFINYALSKDRRLKDWAAGWRNWVTSQFQEPSHGRRVEATKPTITEVLDEKIAKLERERARGDEGSENTPRLLPLRRSQ